LSSIALFICAAVIKETKSASFVVAAFPITILLLGIPLAII